MSVSQLAGLMKYAIMAAEDRNSQKLRTGPLQTVWNIGEWRYSSTDFELRHWMQISVNFHAFAVLHHHHKHQGLDPLICSVSKVTTALSNVSSVFQMFSFLVVCSSMITCGIEVVVRSEYEAAWDPEPV